MFLHIDDIHGSKDLPLIRRDQKCYVGPLFDLQMGLIVQILLKPLLIKLNCRGAGLVDQDLVADLPRFSAIHCLDHAE